MHPWRDLPSERGLPTLRRDRTRMNYYEALMCSCVHHATYHLGADGDHDHITFEARVLFGILMGWASDRSFTHH